MPEAIHEQAGHIRMREKQCRLMAVHDDAGTDTNPHMITAASSSGHRESAGFAREFMPSSEGYP